MTTRRRIILSSAAVVLALLVVTIWIASPSGPPDPVYGGHRLSWWVSDAQAAKSPQILPPGIDSNAIPYLLQTLKTADSGFHKAYLHLYPNLPTSVRNRLAQPLTAVQRKFFALLFLSSMGPTARPAIPQLVLMVNTHEGEHPRIDAIYALSMIATRNDAEVIAALHAASKDQDPNIRAQAVVALQRLDPQFGPDPMAP